jgi:hypothetical protein
MNRPILMCAFFAFASVALSAQQASPSTPYEGTSNPPADNTIETSVQPQPKPRAGKPLEAQPAPAAPVMQQNTQPTYPMSQPTSVAPRVTYRDPDSEEGTDAGIVQVAPEPEPQSQVRPALSNRYNTDPDGDIVHPGPLAPGVLAEGARIRVRLLTRLSTSDSEKGDVFRSRVASDVLQDGQVLIPAGAEIEGRVVDVSSGHMGGHGSMRLRPETVTLADGTRYRIDAQISGTPGSHARVEGEGTVRANSRLKKDGIEYGGAVGAGAVTGAVLGGPVGALAGGLIGAGAITVHLLVDHPQATLEPGTTLLFTLTEPLNLVAAPAAGN